MLVQKNTCAVCKAVKLNKPLLQRIYESKYFVPHSVDTLRKIAADYIGVFGLSSLQNHVKKHQFINSKDYEEKMLELADTNAQRGAVRQAVKGVEAIQKVISIGEAQITEDTKITVNEVLRASQIQMTAEAKQKDQQLAMMDMVAHFLSGESAQDNPRVYVESN